MKLSVIIPTYNGAHLLQKNLGNILHGVKQANAELIIVDNGSADGTKKLSEKYSSIKWIFLSCNTGFTGACNTGALEAKGEYICFINNDCIVTQDTFIQLQTFLHDHVSIVATQPVVQKPNGDTEHIGFWIDTNIAKAHAITSKKEYEQIKEKGLLYGVSGTCLMIKKGVFKNIGLFNKKLHSYLEDVELAITLYEHGYSVEPCFESFITHDHMATSSKMGTYKQQRDTLNWWQIILNHPKTFKLSSNIFIERLRNMNGLIKAILKR